MFALPQHNAIRDAIFDEIVGLEIDGVRVIDAEFRRPMIADDDDPDALGVDLIVTDPVDADMRRIVSGRDAIWRRAQRLVRDVNRDTQTVVLVWGDRRRSTGSEDSR